MKKLLILSSLAAWFLPGLASAAYNDVTVATSTVFTVNGITLEASSSPSTIESITVGATTMTVVIEQGSSFRLTAPNRNQMLVNEGTGQTISTCNGTESTLAYNLTNSSTEVSIVVSPLTTICSDTTNTSSSSRSDARGGGGGGGATVAVATQTTTAETAQINALLAQIASLQAQIAALSGGTTPAAVVTGKITLTANLSKGSRGASVKSLQQFLNTHGFVIATTGPGSPGNETDLFGNLTVKAVQKLQEQYGIASPGIPGYGTVGPKTRAKINELSAN